MVFNSVSCFNLINMKTKIVSSFIFLVTIPSSTEANGANGPNSYLIGGAIAVLILGYLIYSLIWPEKF